MSVNSFLSEFEKRTEQVTSCGLPIQGCRRYRSKVDVQVAHFPHRGTDSIYLAMMSSLERGKGYGSKALRFVCDLADKHGVTLVGEASTNYVWDSEATGPRLNQEQLCDWYRRFGFGVNSATGDMHREPKRQG